MERHFVSDFVGWFGMLFGYALTVAIFSVGIAFWLSTAPRIASVRRRATISGTIAAAILTLVPIVIVATEELGIELLIVGVVLFALGAFMAAVAGFPAAYFASLRFDRRRNHQESAKQ